MNHLHIAAAITVGFALVAVSILFSDRDNFISELVFGTNGENNFSVSRAEKQKNIYGDLKAPITIVEFSDFECVFCARLHPTLKQLVDESEGRVKWEYRHLPLSSHRNAFAAAVASECIARNIGSEAFWDFTELLFAQRGHDSKTYRGIALEKGMAASEYDTCIADPKIASVVDNDSKSALALGGNGTPFSIIVFADGKTKAISGALPIEHWRSALE